MGGGDGVDHAAPRLGHLGVGEGAVDRLEPDGVIAVISYHSGEDRIVKRFLQREASDCICPPEAPACTCGHRASLEWRPRKPATPSPAEVAENPRARSAKLRVARRLR